MATGGQQEPTCSIVQDRILELEMKAGSSPGFGGFVLMEDKLLVTDYKATRNLQIYNRQDGRRISTSDRLRSPPRDVCVVNDDQVAMCLVNGKIVVLSVKDLKRIKTIHLRREGFNFCCYTMVKWDSNQIIVSGKNSTDSMLYWCVVSVVRNTVESTHYICDSIGSGYATHLTIKDDTLYVSCYTSDSRTCGVYYFNVLNPGQPNIFYQHKDLQQPRSVVTDMLCVYVSDWNSKTIHQLTASGQLVTIHNMPSEIWKMFYDVPHGDLYTMTGRRDDNKITVYKTITGIKEKKYTPNMPEGPVMPAEVLKMDKRSLSMYKKALRTGKQKVYNIRVMVVGQYGVGKTTLTKRLLGQDVNISNRVSTEGIDINCCKISLATGKWTKQEKDTDRLQRLFKLLNDYAQNQEAGDGQEGQNTNFDHSAEIENKIKNNDKLNLSQTNKRPMQIESSETKSKPLTHSQRTQTSKQHSDQMASSISTPSMSNKSGTKDPVIEILQLVNKDTGKLKKDMEECATLATWDFAGQYIFYTTHQTFLTNRAIYLLVLNLSQKITDTIKDDKCFIDIKGIESCTVFEMIEIWLNFIHSCTPSKDSGIPAVILVGTHMDKIPENSRQKVEEYFKGIYDKLKDKPTLVHIVGHVAIDNTLCDTNLEKLKGKILEEAKKQKVWGEERPALWIPLEQAIMTLKDSGKKVVPLGLVEEINRSGSVIIDDVQLDLFLRFQHEIGTILYFSVEGLKEKIMLDPQWIIDALKSLITADDFMTRGEWYQLWCKFKDQGKLTHTLIDVIWSREKSPDFHDNKDYLLKLMEKLNIIARPKSYSSDGEDVKEEDYFLAPCMLTKPMPDTVIPPEMQDMCSSVLCFAFVENFLPSPIFHRLLAACVARWPIAKDKNKDNLIYCGCCVFDLDIQHRLTVFFREHVILARVRRIGNKGEIPSARLCVAVREFLTMTLTNIIRHLGQSLQFDLHIRCPLSDDYTVKWLIKVEDLQKHKDVPCICQDNSHTIDSRKMLKFWFVDDDMCDLEIDQHYETPSLQPEVTSPDVFLSYQWGKQTQVMALYERLTSLGYSCWMDKHQMGGGDNLNNRIDAGVRHCKVVVSCVTPKYSLSANCRREVSLADALKKPIIPLLLENMTWPPEGPMSMVFTELLYINCFKKEDFQLKWEGPEFEELLSKLKTYVPAQGQKVATKTAQGQKVATQTAQGQKVAIQTAQGQKVATQTAQGQKVATQTAQRQKIATQTAQGQKVATQTAQRQKVVSQTAQGSKLNEEKKGKSLSEQKGSEATQTAQGSKFCQIS